MADQTTVKRLCGRCGRTYLPPADSPHNNLCPTCKVPHQLMTRIETGMDQWRCGYCGETGTFSHLEETECTATYDPCPCCKGHPYCEPDCADIVRILRENNAIGF